jgi:hypothetical protein
MFLVRFFYHCVRFKWNISDYFYQNREVLRSSLCEEKNKVFPDFPGVPNMAAFDKLWMCLYTKLGNKSPVCLFFFGGKWLLI